MTRVVVTGASGLLGSSLVLALRDSFEVWGVCWRHELRTDGTACLPLDLTRSEQAAAIVGLQPEWIIHCAANTDVDACELRPDAAWEVNVLASRHVAEAARVARARLVYVSTDAVFDGKVGNYRETDQPNPPNHYARTKLAGELATLEIVPEALIVRTSIYGWNPQEKKSLVEWIVDALGRGQSIGGFFDVFFTPILANDLADVLGQMVGGDLFGTYHVAGSERISKLAFAHLVAEVFELDPGLIRPRSIIEARLAAPRPRDASLCTAKASCDLGRSLPSALHGLRRMKRLRERGYLAKVRLARSSINVDDKVPVDA